MVRLGAAYRQTKRTEDARRVLERASSLQPNHAPTVLQLGLTYEDMGEYGQAKGLYERYLTVERSNALKREVGARIPLIQRKELEAAVRKAIENEAQLMTTTPAPRSVAVFPFLFAAADTALQPLSRAMAEMLSTDLAQTDRLTVLERTHVQLLINELKLAQTDLVDPGTAAKSGKLLGAGRIVQGRLDGSESDLRVQAAVVEANTGAADMRTVEQQDVLERLFDMEKRLALDLYASLGIELTVAERERVNQRPTQNLQALLAYGRGLGAFDAGDYAAAAREFSRAAALDRSFSAARVSAQRASGLAVATATSTDQLSQRASAGSTASASSLAAVEALVPGAGGRDAAPEVLGKEGVGKTTVLEIVIRRSN
jgi:tetratricopeptide (TPR) repeat protein